MEPVKEFNSFYNYFRNHIQKKTHKRITVEVE